MTIGRNITRYLRARNLTLPKLALQAGIDKGQLSRIISTGAGYSSISLEKIASALGVSIADLFVEAHNTTLPADLRRVPVLTPAEAISLDRDVLYRRENDQREYIMTSSKYSARTFAVAITDESMAPILNPGETILIDPDVMPRPGHIVFAAAGGGGVARTYAARGRDANGSDICELIPANPLHASMRSDLEPIRIIGVARQRIIELQ